MDGLHVVQNSIMITTLKMIFPTTIDRNTPICCLNQCIRHEQIALETVITPTGCTASGDIVIRDIDYSVEANLSLAGDEIGGTITFVHKRKRIPITNNLTLQKTSFPYLPIFNEWNRLKLSGFSDFITLELSNRSLTTNNIEDNGERNDSINLVLEAIAIQSSTNSIISNQKTPIGLRGSDNTSYSLNRSNKSILTIQKDSIISSMEFELNELTLIIEPGTAKIYGKLTTYIKPDITNNSTITISKPFNSQLTISLYNNTFPWSNQWSLIDNLNPSLSLISPSFITTYLPDTDVQIVVSVKVTGSQS